MSISSAALTAKQYFIRQKEKDIENEREIKLGYRKKNEKNTTKEQKSGLKKVVYLHQIYLEGIQCQNGQYKLERQHMSFYGKIYLIIR